MPEHTPGWAHQRPRCPGRWSCRGVSAPSLRDPQSFLSPKALDLLVIHAPALAAGIVIRRPETATRMDLGVLAQPGPQCGIGILRGCCVGLVTLSRAVLPGDAAGEPFTNPQHPLEVTNGRPPTFRA